MTTPELYHALIERAYSKTRLFFNSVLIIAAVTAGIGLDSILPGEGVYHYLLTAAMTWGVYSCLKLTWNWQTSVFLPLAADRPSGLVIGVHLVGVVTTISLSFILSYFALVGDSASFYDMRGDMGMVLEQGANNKRNYKAISSIKSYVETHLDKTEDKMEAERNGLSGNKGEGPVFRVWEATHRSLVQILALLERQQEKYDAIVHRLDVSETQLRRALNSDLEANERLSAYTKASRSYADTYAELLELGLDSQIRMILSSFLDNAAPPEADLSDKAKSALAIANQQSRKIAGDVDRYIAERVITLKPIQAYQPDSIAVMAWRHLDKHWSQALICAALDISLWFVLLMQLAALRRAREVQETTANPTLA